MAGASTLVWRELAPKLQAALSLKLEGLYGGADAHTIFDSLALDKQRALLIFARRLDELNLWREVLRVTNVYGEGGVGLEFDAAGELETTLNSHAHFTSRFAAHRDTAEGFCELNRAKAALHFLRARHNDSVWTVHFDLYAPLNLSGVLRHLWFEKLLAHKPDCDEIAAALEYDL